MTCRRRRFYFGVTAAAVFGIGLIAGTPSEAEERTGAVYVMTNQATGNSVLVFRRDASGVLSPAGTYLTGGQGSGSGADPLASQGALTLSDDGRFLFAVNAGSNSISMFRVLPSGLTLLDVEPSGGVQPVSVTVWGSFVYALNQGGTPNVSGFEIDNRWNRLLPLANSTLAVPGGTASAPAQVSFTPDGDQLVVTEKGTDAIDTFPLEDGVAGPGMSYPSSGGTPFGFAFRRDDILIVSDAAGGGPGASAVSSYEIVDSGAVEIVTPALGDTQTAACWLVVTPNGRFAFTANAGSGTLSSYAVSEDGRLSLVQTVAASTGDKAPLDMALSRDGKFLYVRDGGVIPGISGFRVEPHGMLTPVSVIGGVPAGAQGIAAR